MTVFPAFATSSWKVKMPSILTRFAKSYALPADFTACYLKTGSVFRMFSLQSVRHWAESPSFIKIFLILSSKAPARCLFLVLQLALSVSNFLHVTTGGFAPPRDCRFKWQEERDRFQRGSNDVCSGEQGIRSLFIYTRCPVIRRN